MFGCIWEKKKIVHLGPKIGSNIFLSEDSLIVSKSVACLSPSKKVKYCRKYMAGLWYSLAMVSKAMNIML